MAFNLLRPAGVCRRAGFSSMQRKRNGKGSETADGTERRSNLRKTKKRGSCRPFLSCVAPISSGLDRLCAASSDCNLSHGEFKKPAAVLSTAAAVFPGVLCKSVLRLHLLHLIRRGRTSYLRPSCSLLWQCCFRTEKKTYRPYRIAFACLCSLSCAFQGSGASLNGMTYPVNRWIWHFQC